MAWQELINACPPARPSLSSSVQTRQWKCQSLQRMQDWDNLHPTSNSKPNLKPGVRSILPGKSEFYYCFVFQHFFFDKCIRRRAEASGHWPCLAESANLMQKGVSNRQRGATYAIIAQPPQGDRSRFNSKLMCLP